jgi:hypothetical protein
MMKKTSSIIILSGLIFFIILSQGCLKEITEKKDTKNEACKEIICNEKCDGTTLNYDGKCIEGKCYYAIETYSPKCKSAPPADTIIPKKPEYAFDTKLMLCDYDKATKKYTLIYQIINKSEKTIQYGSTVWLKVLQTEYASPRTIQNTYKPEKILWEETKIKYMDKSYTGQYWEIRDVNSDQPLDFQLIFCEPNFSEKNKCNTYNGYLLTSGNILEICKQNKTT